MKENNKFEMASQQTSSSSSNSKAAPLASMDGLETPAERAKTAVGTFEEAPAFAQDNEYIRGGYRINFDTAKKIIKSLFMCHNESANVWTHLCGTFLFIFLITYVAIWVGPRFVFPSYEVIKLQLGAYYEKPNNSLPIFYEYLLLHI
jgi:hypothetical protein